MGRFGGTVYDTPQNDPVNVLVQKVDAETGQPYPLGGATLKKSQFTVRYYDTTDAWSLSKDYATRVSAAKRTWVFQTDRDGAIDVSREGPIYADDPDFRYYVSGDALYRDTAGDVTFPVGTYIIEETEPPTGYLLPSCQGRTFIEVIIAEESPDDEHIYTYHKEVFKPITTETGTLDNGTPYTYTGLVWSEWKLPNEK